MGDVVSIHQNLGPQVILIIPETPHWPKVLAGRWRWEPAEQLVEFLPKGRHSANDQDIYPLSTRSNTPQGALLRAIRLEQKRIQRILMP